MNKEFEIRTYSKTELACLYNPDQTIESARQTLRRWIVMNTQLFRELVDIGYNKQSHILTPKQVRVIVKYLGEP